MFLLIDYPTLVNIGYTVLEVYYVAIHSGGEFSFVPNGDLGLAVGFPGPGIILLKLNNTVSQFICRRLIGPR